MITPTEPEPIKSWKDVLIRIGIPIAFTALILYLLLPLIIDEILEPDYYKTENGIQYHCYTGSDYLICDKVGDGVGYD